MNEPDSVEGLKPCPFCGASDHVMMTQELIGGTKLYFVECGYCMASGPRSSKSDYAIDEWNGRFNERSCEDE